MNAAHIASGRVVPSLLVIGERERFQSPQLGRLQAAALNFAPVTTDFEHRQAWRRQATGLYNRRGWQLSEVPIGGPVWPGLTGRRAGRRGAAGGSAAARCIAAARAAMMGAAGPAGCGSATAANTRSACAPAVHPAAPALTRRRRIPSRPRRARPGDPARRSSLCRSSPPRPRRQQPCRIPRACRRATESRRA
jgi:hypothetical protein